jgi:hypothetical protein
MESYNENRLKCIDAKGRIWTYLINSITKTFYNELDSGVVDQFAQTQDIHGLYKLIENHASKGTDSKGINAFTKLLQYKQLDYNEKGKPSLQPFLQFLSNWENLASQLKGKDREPDDQRKAEILVQAVIFRCSKAIYQIFSQLKLTRHLKN